MQTKSDSDLKKLARLLVNYSLAVKKDDKVSISGTTAAEPLLCEIYKEVLLSGGHPRVHMRFQGQSYQFLKLAQDFQIDYVDPISLCEVENITATIQIKSDLNTQELTSISPEKKQKAIQAQKPITDIFHRRDASGELRWTLSIYPTLALAQEAHMAFDEYKEFVHSCMHLDEDDPIAFWKDFSAKQQIICDKLNQTKEIVYIGKDTNLKFSCAGRKWINCDGRVNFPDGEVFISPVESSLEGTIRFDYPGIFMSEEIEDIFLRFEKGKVVEAKAKKGEKLLQKLLDTDTGARYAGEIAIGTNVNINRFTKNMLFDEKMGGTIHLALGNSFPDSGGTNKSLIHWDMLKNMREGGEILADGKLIYQNGAFI